MHNTAAVSSTQSYHPLFTRPTNHHPTNPPAPHQSSTATNCIGRRQCLMLRSNAHRWPATHWPRFDYLRLWRLLVMLLVGGHLVAANVVSPLDDHRSNSTANSTQNTSTTNSTALQPPPIGNQPPPVADQAAASTHWMDTSSNQVVGAVQLKSVQQANQQQKPTVSGGDDDDYYYEKDDDMDEYELLIANKSGEFRKRFKKNTRLLVIE